MSAPELEEDREGESVAPAHDGGTEIIEHDAVGNAPKNSNAARCRRSHVAIV